MSVAGAEKTRKLEETGVFGEPPELSPRPAAYRTPAEPAAPEGPPFREGKKGLAAPRDSRALFRPVPLRS